MPVCGSIDRYDVDLNRVVGAVEPRSIFRILDDADPERRMPLSNLLECCSKPGGILCALDFCGEAEMHGVGQRIEIKEPLATA